ncbi:MAG: ATP-dependent DNA helicase RecG [Candidatus Parcubacteria bacterium]|nr:ATP-dependent DNA helicase RecG [Candidatus Parcubacteria bacterium]
MFSLSDPVSKLHGVGPRYLNYFEKLGIATLRDLLWHFPFRYEDFSHYKKIEELEDGEVTTIHAKVVNIKNKYIFPRRMYLTEAKLEDETGSISAVWFNQPYLTKNIPIDALISVSGKVSFKKKKKGFVSPAYEIINTSEYQNQTSKLRHTGRLIPVYPETAGLTSRALRYFIQPIINISDKLIDPLPLDLRKRHELLELKKALRQIHFPDTLEDAVLARERFLFEELFLVQLHLIKDKEKYKRLKAVKMDLDIPLIQNWVTQLPFKLTDAQRKVIWQIMHDLNSGRPMMRLLEGDVGSGKTLIAIASALLTVKSGYQAVFLVPTEILARQHFQTFSRLINGKIKMALLTASSSEIKEEELEGKVSKKVLLEKLSEGDPVIVIGTHALIQKQVEFGKLGLIMVDEQHRFGVEQRSALIEKNKEEKLTPHLLSMTATPIPRTLALAIYGDLEISILDEIPAGRQKIITEIVMFERQMEIFDFVKQEISKGRQAFIICPRIEPSEEQIDVPENLLSFQMQLEYEVKAVKKEFQKLKEGVFQDYNLAMLYGKMKASEKEKIMADFSQGSIDILIATSVVEVGIDIPNATVMIIEGSDHFGLAQLHQFRGRVGRGEHQSYCFLFSQIKNGQTQTRLQAMVNCHDGFKLAEEDLKIRGPGQFLGSRQSGFPDLAMASLKDISKVEAIKKEAKMILTQDPKLEKTPNLRERFLQFERDLKIN